MIVGGVVWVQMGRTPLFYATKAEVVQLLTAADAAVNHVCQVRCLGVNRCLTNHSSLTLTRKRVYVGHRRVRHDEVVEFMRCLPTTGPGGPDPASDSLSAAAWRCQLGLHTRSHDCWR